MSALDIATLPENSFRYRFLVYNISLVLWKIINPFLRSQRAKHFLPEMQKTCSALEAVNESDMDWRVLILSATAFCLEDDKQNKAASDLVDKALEFAEKELAKVVEEEDRLLEESKKSAQETEVIMSAIRQREEWEDSRFKKKKIDPDAPEEETVEEEEQELPPLEGLAAEEFEVLRRKMEKVQGIKMVVEEQARVCTERRQRRQEGIYRLYMQRIQVNPGDAKGVQGRASVEKVIRAKTLTQLQCIISGIIPEKDIEVTLQQLVTSLEAVPMSPDISETLLDICRIAWSVNIRDLAIKACVLAETEKNLTPLLRSKIDVCKALKIVADISFDCANEILEQRLTVKQTEGYAVERRIEAIKILERVLGFKLSP